MGQTSDEIRQDIEETRERMTETADALGYKADVKTRAKDIVEEGRGRLEGDGRASTPGASPMAHAAASDRRREPARAGDRRCGRRLSRRTAHAVDAHGGRSSARCPAR